MQKKILILYIPVIHKGYLDLFERIQDNISKVYILDEELQNELSEIKPDIAAISAEKMKDLLVKLGFNEISMLSKDSLEEVKGKEIILVQDEISRNLYNKYLIGEKVEWESVFLRWDKSKILSEQPLGNIPISQDSFDIKMMEEAYKEAEESSDWWRQIGAVLVKNKTILSRAYNQDIPSGHTPYQVGEVRDFFKAGERQELASTIHAEQKIVAEAAKKGISLEGTSLYVNIFPCPVCAKLIAFSGIKNLYFGEGGSNFDAKKVLDSAGVNIVYIKCGSI